MRLIRIIIFFIALFGLTPKSQAISFDLDSIAKWGKFAKFCVDTYYWGDRVFNTYDTAYVKGTGKKFNIKLTSQSWIDSYSLDMPEDVHMAMLSDVASNVGVHLSYLAVSVGYDMNINKFFNGYERTRKRVNFNFNCALFSADFYIQNNDLTTKIRELRTPTMKERPDIKFNGMQTDRWGLDIYYFFNNKRYSQVAAFNYTRLQIKSQGSWYLGLSYCNQKYYFDFNSLPNEIIQYLPSEFIDNTYRADTRNYAIKGGYAFNWVPRKNWLIAFSESPLIGFNTGHVNDYYRKSVAISNLLRAGVAYNYRNLFVGLQASLYTNFARGQVSTLVGNVFSAEFSVGYRFNLW